MREGVEDMVHDSAKEGKCQDHVSEMRATHIGKASASAAQAGAGTGGIVVQS